MSKRLSMRKIQEILRLHFDKKRSHREVASSICVSASTVSDCLKRARKSGISWPPPDGLDDVALERLLYQSARNNTEQKSRDINFSVMHKELKRKGVTLYLLWHEYKGQHEEGLSYSRFCFLYRAWNTTYSCYNNSNTHLFSH